MLVLLVAIAMASAVPASAQLVPTGPETRVSGNRPVKYVEELPKIAADDQGNFVVVWQGGPIYYSSLPREIVARRFDAAAIPLAPPFAVSTYTTTTRESAPDVAADATGNFVIAWTSSRVNPAGVFARLYDSEGVASGDEFHVSVDTPYSAKATAVAKYGGGNFIVVWATDYDVFARRYSAAGLPQGGAFRVSTPAGGVQIQRPAVAVDGAGNAVVAWEVYDYLAERVFIRARRFDVAGLPLGPEVQVSAPALTAGPPAVAPLPAGGFVVTWVGGGWDILVRRFDGAGVALGPEFLVNSYTTGVQLNPAVAADGAGGFLVAWQGHSPVDSSSSDVSALRFDASGNPIGDAIAINSYTTGSQANPDVTPAPGGSFIATWKTYGQFSSTEVMVQRLTLGCGNGTLEAGEGCDDGANVDGDGCDHACVPENCQVCSGSPSTCTPVTACADGDGCCLSGCEASNDDDCPTHITGKWLRIKDHRDSNQVTNINFLTRDRAIDVSPGTGMNPAADGASFHVYNPTTGDSACYELEPVSTATWQTLGRDPSTPTLLYTDSQGVNGPCRSARIGDGRYLRITCPRQHLTSYLLDEPTHGPVAVRFRSGSTEYCALFGGVVQYEPQLKYGARDAPASATCPEPPRSCP